MDKVWDAYQRIRRAVVANGRHWYPVPEDCEPPDLLAYLEV
jgi:hypothetical protein